MIEDLAEKAGRAAVFFVLVRLFRSRKAALGFQVDAAFRRMGYEFVDSGRQEANGKYQKSYAGISKQLLSQH
jgi:hypothetical protein